jgi:hypothetical protein
MRRPAFLALSIARSLRGVAQLRDRDGAKLLLWCTRTGLLALVATVWTACASDPAPVYRGYPGHELPAEQVARLAIHAVDEVRRPDGELVELERFGRVTMFAPEPRLDLPPGTYRVLAHRPDCGGGVRYKIDKVVFVVQVVAGRAYEERIRTDRGWVNVFGFCSWARELSKYLGPYEMPVFNLDLAVFDTASGAAVGAGALVTDR